MPARPFAIALAATALAGLGCSDRDDDRGAARGAVAAFLFDCDRRAGALAAELLVPAARDAFVDARSTAAACARVLRVPARTDLRAARIDAVAVADGSGTATIALPSRRTQLRLTRARDGWRIEGPD